MSIVFVGICFFLVDLSDAMRCFECKNVPFPRDCAKLTVCNTDEYCVTEQIVTTSGNVVYNSGCLSKSRCSIAGSMALVGKRSSNITEKRSTDLVTCTECCTRDFCNMNGCGVAEIPSAHRGPYCYNCDGLHPSDCRNVAICDKNELCLVYSPPELSGLPETIYRGQCESQSKCDDLPGTYINEKCIPRCCSTDFCNDRCEISTNEVMTSLVPNTIVTTVKTTTKTSIKTTVKTSTMENTTSMQNTCITPSHVSVHFHCYTYGGYQHLKDEHAELCVHIVHQKLSWNEARAACRNEGGDLVVFDHYVKSSLMRNTLVKQNHFHYSFYWIGVRDFEQRNHFQWVNCRVLHRSEADWYASHHYPPTTVNDCAAMSSPSFMWQARQCNEKGYFICERK